MNYIYKLRTLRDLIEKHISKTRYRPLKTANEVLMLIDAVLYDIDSIEHFDAFGSDSDVYMLLEENLDKPRKNRKIKKIKVGNKNMRYVGNFGELNKENKNGR